MPIWLQLLTSQVFGSAAVFSNGAKDDAVVAAGTSRSHVTDSAVTSSKMPLIVSAEFSWVLSESPKHNHNLGTFRRNLQAAISISDLDMAADMAFTKNNILQHAATAMLASS